MESDGIRFLEQEFDFSNRNSTVAASAPRDGEIRETLKILTYSTRLGFIACNYFGRFYSNV